MPRYGVARVSKPKRGFRPGKVLLAKNYDGRDPTGWWVSEKLDGCRAVWDGARFLSRAGNVFVAPDWFTAGLPHAVLDGELWLGRGRFDEVSGIVRRSAKRAGWEDEWRGIRYMVFDLPTALGGFEARMAQLDRLRLPGHAEVVAQVRCRGPEHLKERLAKVLAAGGEGLMLREPGSPYVAKRSGTLLKCKAMLDAEAVVVGHQPGRGKHRGKMGALVCETKAGVRFKIGTGFSDYDRAHPPKIGDVVTFTYQELSAKSGKPRFPAFLRVRRPEPGARRVAFQRAKQSHRRRSKCRRVGGRRGRVVGR